MRSRPAFLVVALVAVALGPPAGGSRAAEPVRTQSKRSGKSGALPAPRTGSSARPEVSAPPSVRASAFKLKPGASGALCLDCHANFAPRLSKPSVHTPVKARDCVACHNPHASSHGKMLEAEGSALCAKCHPSIVPSPAKSAHEPVAESRCSKCHDPHSSQFGFNLVRSGNDLCAGCHAAIAEPASSAKVKHRPVAQGCVVCHEPHGSPTAASLLKSDVPRLCLGCHDVDSPTAVKRHMGYPVKQARCTTCHDPHGSYSTGLLYATVHAPVAKGMCSMCHEPAASRNPLATRQHGAALCRGCHAPRMARMLEANRVHQPVLEGACLACHGPHASKQRGLVRGNMVVTCGACHADTIRRHALSPTKHKPIARGECTSCHTPHSSSAPLLLVKADQIELCGTCHDWQRHSTHPIGESKIDRRNKNLTLDCASCHRAHGTASKHLLPAAKVSDLCTSCHDTYRR